MSRYRGKRHDAVTGRAAERILADGGDEHVYLEPVAACHAKGCKEALSHDDGVHATEQRGGLNRARRRALKKARRN